MKLSTYILTSLITVSTFVASKPLPKECPPRPLKPTGIICHSGTWEQALPDLVPVHLSFDRPLTWKFWQKILHLLQEFGCDLDEQLGISKPEDEWRTWWGHMNENCRLGLDYLVTPELTVYVTPFPATHWTDKCNPMICRSGRGCLNPMPIDECIARNEKEAAEKEAKDAQERARANAGGILGDVVVYDHVEDDEHGKA